MSEVLLYTERRVALGEPIFVTRHNMSHYRRLTTLKTGKNMIFQASDQGLKQHKYGQVISCSEMKSHSPDTAGSAEMGGG
jgi:hypothetical protein